MNLNQINYLIQVVNCGSIKKAAEVLGIKRTTLLMSLSALEDELGQNILLRQKNGTTLVEEQSDLFDIIQKMQKKITEIETLRQELTQKNIAQIYSSSPILISLIEKVNNSYFSLQQTKKPIVQMSMNYSAETDFIFTMELPTNLSENYNQYQLFDSPYCICLRNTHPLTQKNFLELTPEEISYPIISLSDEPLQGYNYQSINNFSSLQRIISTSDCLALIPEIFLKHISSPFISSTTSLKTKNLGLSFKAFLLVRTEILEYPAALNYLNYILSTFKE